MRQNCVRNASKGVLFQWEKRNVPKCVRNASKLRQKCIKNPRNTFGGGGGHLLDDTKILERIISGKYHSNFQDYTSPLYFSIIILRTINYSADYTKQCLESWKA